MWCLSDGPRPFVLPYINLFVCLSMSLMAADSRNNHRTPNVVLFVPRLLIFLEKLECVLLFGVRSEDPLLGNGGIFYLTRSGVVARQDNKQVVFSFLSVLGLLLGNENKPLPRERFYRGVSPGTYLPRRCPGNVFTETLPRERV
jgi:hypothetical protein